jgi:VCBS repeat protein
MSRLDGRSRLAWAALAVLSCLATGYAPHGEASSSWSRFVPGTAALFRLGTAGRPFAWSTAIGDLNGDGTPDYAVADRIGHDLAGFQYSVDLSISGAGSQHVTFSSPDAALSIALRDVDHDQDLDVVVSTVLSPGVVRIWLNDGTGAFAETGAFDTVSWRAVDSIVPDSPDSTLIGIAAAPRRARDALGLRYRDSSGAVLRSIALVRSDVRADSHRGTTSGSRAPPAAAALFL